MRAVFLINFVLDTAHFLLQQTAGAWAISREISGLWSEYARYLAAFYTLHLQLGGTYPFMQNKGRGGSKRFLEESVWSWS